jgi:hypothetical protein
MAVVALAGCGRAGAPDLEGTWEAHTGRGVSWRIHLADEGTGIIGRASYINSSGTVFRDVPVYGPYPQIRYDVTVPPRAPTVAQVTQRFVFVGRMRDDCNANCGACIRGNVSDGRPSGFQTWLDLCRVGP